MSFSSDVKDELIRLEIGKPCCQLAELAALTMTIGSLTFRGGVDSIRISFRTESAALARRIFLLLRKYFAITPHLHFVQNDRLGGRRVCVLTIDGDNAHTFLLAMQMMTIDENGEPSLRRFRPKLTITRQCCRRAFMRGAFLGNGHVTTPEKDYRLEWTADDEELEQQLTKALDKSNLPVHTYDRRGHKLIYLKDAQSIADVLAMMEASASVLKLENVRIQKQMKQSANRASNCDVHNTDRQISAAQQQVEAIKKIYLTRGLDSLPKALAEIARLRLENSEMSLTDLGQLLTPPVGKSGVNHRLRRLTEIARQLEEESTEAP